MEKIQKLKLDFTETGSREEFLSTYCGDMNSNVIELDVTPALKDNELLICSFLKDGAAVETLVVKSSRMVIPYSVLKEAGSYTAAFAVADIASRLTATATLSVTVANDSILIAPTEDMKEDQSLISYILSSSAIAARAAVEEDIDGLTEAVSSLSDTLEVTNESLHSMDSDLSLVASDVELMRKDVDALLNTSPNERIFANGPASLSSSSGPYACMQGDCSWVRINDTVILRFTFYTSSLTELTVTGLPFSCNSEVIACPVSHVNYNAPFVNITGDLITDRAELRRGETSFTLYRTSSSAAVVSGTLVYQTSDPMPE